MRSSEIVPSVGVKWRYGSVGGLAALPFSLVSYWQTGSEVSFVPVLLAALVVGYAARRRTGVGRGVGARVGLVGSLAILPGVVDLVGSILGFTNPVWFAVVSLLMLVVFAVLGVGIAVLVGEVGGRIGSWLSDRRGGTAPRATG